MTATLDDATDPAGLDRWRDLPALQQPSWPDKAALAAIGSNLLDPARRKPAAEAGRVQAASVAEAVREVWN